MTVPALALVTTVAPAGLATSPASSSLAVGFVGSEPGRSLSSGRTVTGCPTSPRATSGWVVAATALVAVGPWTVTSIEPATGALRPSDTWYASFCGPPLTGAVERRYPSGRVLTAPA